MDELGNAMAALERLRRRASGTVSIRVAHIQADIIKLQELINREGEQSALFPEQETTA